MTRWLLTLSASLFCVQLHAQEADTALPGPATQQSFRQTYQVLLEKHAAAIVNVDYVLTMRFMGQTSDQDGDATGVVVSPDGLILMTRSRVQPDLPSFAAPDSDFTPPEFEARDFRVTVPTTGEAFEAHLIARDPALDLMWIKLQDAGRDGDEPRFAWVDFSESADFSPGQSVYSIDRLSAWFGHAAHVLAGSVIGETTIPRRFGILDFPGSSGAVFDSQGRVLGLVVNPQDTEGSADHVGWMNMELVPRPFLLPGELVARANRDAIEAAAASD